VKLATKYRCQNAGNEAAGLTHTRGNGRPTRKTCQYCHGRFYVETGLWGAFEWTGDGRYPEANALVTFTNEGKADTYAAGLYEADNNSNVVIRWIPKSAG
jgi:hypothetical protein